MAPSYRPRGCAGKSDRKLRGISLLEMLVALLVLAFGLLSLLPLIALSTRQGELSRYRTSSTAFAQRQMEQILVHPFAPGGAFTDRDGHLVQVGCVTGVTTCGAPLNAAGLVNFSKPAVAGYSFSVAEPDGATYDVRWSVTLTTSGTKQFVVAVRARTPIFNIPAVQLRTLVAP